MKNITKEILYTLAASALVVSCAKDVVVDDPGQTGSGVVTFASEITTRVTGDLFDNGDTISVTAYDSVTTDATAENVEYTYSNSLFSSETPIRKGEDDYRTYLAVYPYVEVDDLTFSFEVETDQSVSNTLSDLMYSEVEVTTADVPTLTFERLMSKVTISIINSDLDLETGVEATLNAKIGADIDIEHTSLMATGDVASIKMQGAVTSSTTASYSAIVVPQTIEANATIATIVVDGTVHTLSLDDENTLGVGKSYELEVEIESDTVKVSFSEDINGWEEGEWGCSKVEFTTEEAQALSADDKATTLDLNTLTEITGENVTLAWVSSNEDVATVDGGVVTAVAGGEATITVSIVGGAATAFDTIDVVVTESVASFTLSASTLELEEGEVSTALTVTDYAPESAYPVPTFEELTLVWSVEDDSVATVDGGVVTGVAAGTTTVTATIDGSTATGSCEVTVNEFEIKIGTYYVSSTKTFTNLSTTSNIDGIVYSIREDSNTAMVLDVDFAVAKIVWATTADTYGTYNALINDVDETDGRVNMKNIQDKGDTTFSVHAAFKNVANNNSSIPTYEGGELDTWYLGSLYETSELYAGFSGLKLVYDDASTGEVSYTDWILNPYLGNPDDDGYYVLVADCIMPGALDDDQKNARLDFNEKILAVGGTFLWTADDTAYYTNAFRSYWTSTDIAPSTHTGGTVALTFQFAPSTAFLTSDVNFDGYYGSPAIKTKSTTNDNIFVRAIMEVALPIVTDTVVDDVDDVI